MRPLKLVKFLLIVLSCSNNLFYSHYKHAVYWGQLGEGDWTPAGDLQSNTGGNIKRTNNTAAQQTNVSQLKLIMFGF